MAAPQSQYSHPGPSTYYQHPPPPQYGYGTHSPGPYQYAYPLPHPMHGPSSPRMNGQGRGGSYSHTSSRGGHGYQNYHSMSPQHFTHPPPPPNTYTPPQGKYPQQIPYSAPYALQPTSPYVQPWPSQQPISPLPKQLSMPPPTPPVSRSLDPSRPEDSVPSPHNYPDISIASSPLLHPASSPEAAHPPDMSKSPPDPQMLSLQDLAPIQTAVAASTSEGRPGGWVIWSRRPDDPSQAPGIIISPRANPPPNVIRNALKLSTPPASPRKTVPLQLSIPPTDNNESSSHSSPEHMDVPSSSATETTPACSTAPDTPMPSSPVSSNTSLSLAATSPDRGKASSLPQPSPKLGTVEPPATEESAPTSEVSSVLSPETAPQPQPSSIPTLTILPTVKKSWASILRSDGSAPSSSSKSSLPISSVVGFSIPAIPATGVTSSAFVPQGKKSDLLSLLTSGPSGPAATPKIRSRGLVNSGNMCFANAVLQVLVYCPPFYRLFTELGKYLTGPVVGEIGKGTPLVDATIQFLKEFSPTLTVTDEKAKGKEVENNEDIGPESFIPSYIYDALKENTRFDNMRGGHQEDAEEFLGFFLDTLEEELLTVAELLNPSSRPSQAPGPAEDCEEEAPPQEDGWLEVGKRNRTVITRTIKTADSPITKIFGGKFRSTLRAPHQKDSVVVEDWRSLRLDIQREQIHTVKEALQYISHPQSVQMTHSSRPNVTIDASQQILVEALPPILILHMKRFLYDTTVGDVVKVGKQVSFGAELEIGADLMAPARKMHSTRYKLFGVLYHHGFTASGGHYTLDVLHPNRDMSAKPREAWIRIDDELVSEVRPEDVFNGSERDDRCAYLLFYRRVGVASRT